MRENIENNAKDVVNAYMQMRRRADPSGSLCTTFPTRLLIEFDNVRCNLNPNAPLSYAQKLLEE